MKICYIFTGVYQAEFTGQPAVGLLLIDHIDKKGNQTYLISNYLSPSGYFYENGNSNLLLKGPNTLGTYLKSTRRILKYLEEIKPDILHVRGLLMVIYVWVLNKLFMQYPLVISIFETPEHLHFLYRRLISFCINRAEIAFVPSNFVKKQFMKSGALSEKILVRHTELENKFLSNPKVRLATDTDIVFFGDSTKERGFDVIYKLAKKLKKANFKVLIRWEGENCKSEHRKIKKLKNVRMWHYPYKESLEKILSKTKLVVLPFRYMGMRPPISLLESMALGKCVITSDMGGNEELIKHGENGFIYSFSDLDRVSEKIKFLLNHDEVRNSIGQEAKRTIKGRYSPEEYDKINNYYSYITENFYERRMFDSVGGKYVSSKEVSLAKRMLCPRENDYILDVGTGSGRFAREIVMSSKARVMGIDPDRKILREGEMLRSIFLTGEENKRYKCILHDGHRLPFADGEFSKVFSFRSLKYYRDPWRGIDEMIRVLRADGELVLEITSNLSWESLVNLFLSKAESKRERKVTHFWEKRMRSFNLHAVKNYLSARNMILIEEKPLHKIPPRLFTKLNNQLTNRVLDVLDKILIKTTPNFLFSKSIILKYRKL
ncbi:glycosyltransferase [Candidatus Gottesmanbacteria bacterium]|nr:glycosyltransferase [Candidatus Gottesmanbacteria bacterium]